MRSPEGERAVRQRERPGIRPGDPTRDLRDVPRQVKDTFLDIRFDGNDDIFRILLPILFIVKKNLWIVQKNRFTTTEYRVVFSQRMLRLSEVCQTIDFAKLRILLDKHKTFPRHFSV